MALTVAVVDKWNLAEGLSRVMLTVTADASYDATNGETLNLSAAGIDFDNRVTSVVPVACTLNTEVAKGKPLYVNPDMTSTDDGVLRWYDGATEVADTTDLSASIWTVVVEGY